MARNRGSSKYPERCSGCRERKRSGTSISTGRPISSSLPYPKSRSACEFTRTIVPARSTMTIASGAASRRPRNFPSTFFRSVTSRIAAVTRTPSFVRIGRGLHQAAEPVLRVPALGDVADDARDDQPVTGLEGAQADLRRKFAPVLAPAGKVEVGAHRPCPRIDEVFGAVLQVHSAYALGQQELDRLLQELAALVAEYLLGLRVGERDAPFAVHPVDGVASRFD